MLANVSATDTSNVSTKQGPSMIPLPCSVWTIYLLVTPLLLLEYSNLMLSACHLLVHTCLSPWDIVIVIDAQAQIHCLFMLAKEQAQHS